jgi:hypothetical protein
MSITTSSLCLYRSLLSLRLDRHLFRLLSSPTPALPLAQSSRLSLPYPDLPVFQCPVPTGPTAHQARPVMVLTHRTSTSARTRLARTRLARTRLARTPIPTRVVRAGRGSLGLLSGHGRAVMGDARTPLLRGQSGGGSVCGKHLPFDIDGRL